VAPCERPCSPDDVESAAGSSSFAVLARAWRARRSGPTSRASPSSLAVWVATGRRLRTLFLAHDFLSSNRTCSAPSSTRAPFTGAAPARRAASAAGDRTRPSRRARLRCGPGRPRRAHERQRESQHGARGPCASPERPVPVGAERVVVPAYTSSASSRSASTPTGSPGGTPSATAAARRRTARPRRAPSSCASTQPARHASARRPAPGRPGWRHAVDAVAEERERREGAPRLGEDDVLGRQHQPHARVRAGQQLRHLVELGVQPLDRVEDRVLRHRYAGGAGQHRAERLHARRSTGKTRSMYQPSASGSASSRSVSAVGAQSTTIVVPVPGERVQAQLQERQHLLGARDDGQLLGRDRVDAGGVEHAQQVALDVGPGLLEPALGVDLLDEQVVGDGVGVEPIGVPKASASECAASVERTSVRWPREAARTAVAEAVVDLPTPPLPVKAGSARPSGAQSDSTRFLRPFSAVSMRIFSPLRLSMPISGIETSSGEPVGHLGASRRPRSRST
jgi:hypothetical protein